MTFCGLRARVLFFLLAGSFLFILPSAEAAVHRVDPAGTCTTDCGGTWATAFPDIESAMWEMSSYDEIWVKTGTYALTSTLHIFSREAHGAAAADFTGGHLDRTLAAAALPSARLVDLYASFFRRVC